MFIEGEYVGGITAAPAPVLPSKSSISASAAARAAYWGGRRQSAIATRASRLGFPYDVDSLKVATAGQMGRQPMANSGSSIEKFFVD